MKFTRWYDKDAVLKHIVYSLENFENNRKLEIADEIIQMIIDGVGVHSDELIHDLNSIDIPNRRRWYDVYENLHSAVEMLKIVDEKNRKDIISDIFNQIETYKSELG